MAGKKRLDRHLVDLKLAESRQQAQALIRSGRVRHPDGSRLEKPGLLVQETLEPRVDLPPRFVSRGGEKLEGALAVFPIRVQGRICLDAGISTGGFSDCLLQRGAARVHGVDVGYGQTAWRLRTDPRLHLLERTNLRHLTAEELYAPEEPWADLAVADVSFIALAKLMAPLRRLVDPAASEAVLLVKPQFELGRHRVGRGGVVRRAGDRLEAVELVARAARDQGWHMAGVLPAPITGPAGNQEYLLWLRSTPVDGVLDPEGLGVNGAGHP
jgi:23S rRNA (cytidine1920-2'-O)/16S rRNA (cytidine1409-2'-O)-methyltransferase